MDQFFFPFIVHIEILPKVAVDFCNGRPQSLALPCKMDLINAMSRPASVTEKHVVLKKEKPFIFHLGGNKPCHDQFALFFGIPAIQRDGRMLRRQRQGLPVRSLCNSHLSAALDDPITLFGFRQLLQFLVHLVEPAARVGIQGFLQ
jgi:hypothetical protein